VNYRLTGLLVALSAMAIVATPGESRADYVYTTSALSVVPSAPASLGQSITLLPSGSVSDSSPALAQVLAITYNPTEAIFGITQNVSFTETLTGTPGTQAVSISGTLNILFAGPIGVVASFTGVTTTVLSGSGYTLPANFVTYASISPTGKNAIISIGILPVPEPASLGMAAMGLGIVGFVGFRRSRRSA
jgi:hypothetical protein